MQQLDGRTKAKNDRLDFAAQCIMAVLPGPKEDRQPKAALFEAAAVVGLSQDDCPTFFSSTDKLRTYIRNHWPRIRIVLGQDEGVLPCYVNGSTFEGGGGYRRGNVKLARKQVEVDAKIVDGVVSATNKFAEVTGGLFPQIEVAHRTVRVRRITAEHA
jgi:hypothetical protein